MDQHPVLFVVPNQPNNVQGTTNQYVQKKKNDSNDLELFTLKTNQSQTIFSLTPQTEWLTLNLLEKKNLLKQKENCMMRIRHLIRLKFNIQTHKNNGYLITKGMISKTLQQNQALKLFQLVLIGQDQISLFIQKTSRNIHQKSLSIIQLIILGYQFMELCPGKRGLRPKQIEFKQFFSSYGILIRGKGCADNYIAVENFCIEGQAK
ncbi:hypothetical protein pb186bvf_015720 [Paramecium bursaria]